MTTPAVSTVEKFNVKYHKKVLNVLFIITNVTNLNYHMNHKTHHIVNKSECSV